MEQVIDSHEVVAKMMEYKASSGRYAWEFFQAMDDLYPEFMARVLTQVQLMESLSKYESEINHAV